MRIFRCCGIRYLLFAGYDDRGEYAAEVCTDAGGVVEECRVCGRSFEDEGKSAAEDNGMI